MTHPYASTIPSFKTTYTHKNYSMFQYYIEDVSMIIICFNLNHKEFMEFSTGLEDAVNI